MAKQPTGGEQPDLSDEEEALLDQVWDRLNEEEQKPPRK